MSRSVPSSGKPSRSTACANPLPVRLLDPRPQGSTLSETHGLFACLNNPMNGVTIGAFDPAGISIGQPRRRTGWVLAVALVIGMGVAVIAWGLGATTSQARDVIGDDDRDVFVGTGSLILPEGMSRPGREAAANCPGCQWRATLACDPVSPTACRGQARLCPNDHFWLKISMMQPGGPWQVLGSQCFGPAGPTSREAFEISVSQRIEQAVPSLRPSHRPPSGALPWIPVIFDSGHPSGTMNWTWSIVGMPVTVWAQPSWAWQFHRGGSIMAADTPGGPSSRDGISHTYRTRGTHEVTVRATWRARYSVGSLGPLSVDEAVNQVEQFPVQIGEARAVLRR